MKPLEISTRLLSEAVWKKLFEASANRYLEKHQEFFRLMASLESLRGQAAYNTGSISTAAAWSLYALAHYFGPRRMLEIGTFIGKSTLALALGADDAGTGIDLHTCDMSNRLTLPRASKCAIRQYPGKSSTAMLTEIAAQDRTEGPFDLLYLDGRLQAADFPLLAQLCSPELVVALDDFEGMEKGVANLVNIRTHQFVPSHVLIYPCAESLLRQFGFMDHASTALLIPRQAVRLTAQ